MMMTPTAGYPQPHSRKEPLASVSASTAPASASAAAASKATAASAQSYLANEDPARLEQDKRLIYK